MLRRSRYGVDGLVRLGAISHGSAVVVRFGLVGSDVVRRSGRDPVRSVAVCSGGQVAFGRGSVGLAVPFRLGLTGFGWARCGRFRCGGQVQAGPRLLR
jgi:hypothetical protein